MPLIVGLILGGPVGALLGLVVATLVNANCDSFVETAFTDCTRLDVGPMVGLAAGVGAFAGLLIGAIWEGARDARRRRRS